eukprot:2628835-Amphidinium_carterae.1
MRPSNLPDADSNYCFLRLVAEALSADTFPGFFVLLPDQPSSSGTREESRAQKPSFTKSHQ